MTESELVATFSIVGRDPQTGELGVAVQSKFLSVGSVVPWAAAGAGAVATQSLANTQFGPRGLELLRRGLSAEEALTAVLEGDSGREYRQVGIVDGQGRSASFTGRDCLPWAGGVTGPNFAAQGNILVSSETVEAMARTFQETPGDLAHRLTEALEAGQRAGGDSRGRQSAALCIVKEAGGYGGRNDRYIDLRVDDHPEPIEELKRLLGLWRLYFEKPAPQAMLRLEGELLDEVIARLDRLGYAAEGQPFPQLWRRFVGTENFEERDIQEGYIDPLLLDWIRQRT
ncbi:MAG: DUF1028 domain-containing protein [Bacillota bacterium]